MKRYDENQGYNWWSWMEYLWDDVFNKVEDKVFDIKNDVLAALIGLPVIPTMILTFGVLSLVMLIPHTFEWAHLSLIRMVDKLIDDYEKPFMISFIQVLLIFTTLGVISPFLVWVGPKIIYDVIKEKREAKQARETIDPDFSDTEREIREQRERMADFLRGDGPEIRRQPKPDFTPRKRIKAHSLKDKKGPTFVSPGVYVNETDHSYVTVGGYETVADYTRREIARARERYDRELGIQVNHVRERVSMIDPWGGDNDNYRPMEYNE